MLNFLYPLHLLCLRKLASSVEGRMLIKSWLLINTLYPHVKGSVVLYNQELYHDDQLVASSVIWFQYVSKTLYMYGTSKGYYCVSRGNTYSINGVICSIVHTDNISVFITDSQMIYALICDEKELRAMPWPHKQLNVRRVMGSVTFHRYQVSGPISI